MKPAYFLGAEGGTVYNVLGDQVRVLNDPDAAGGIFETFAITAPKGSFTPPHLHAWPECFYMLEGEMEVMLAGETRTVGPGTFIFAPPQTPHAYTVVSERARYLAIAAGGGAGGFFKEVNDKITGPIESLEPVVEIAMAHNVALA